MLRKVQEPGVGDAGPFRDVAQGGIGVPALGEAVACRPYDLRPAGRCLDVWPPPSCLAHGVLTLLDDAGLNRLCASIRP